MKAVLAGEIDTESELDVPTFIRRHSYDHQSVRSFRVSRASARVLPIAKVPTEGPVGFSACLRCTRHATRHSLSRMSRCVSATRRSPAAHRPPTPRPPSSGTATPRSRSILPSGKSILIDPWITNPSNPTGKDDVEDGQGRPHPRHPRPLRSRRRRDRHREAHEGASSSRRSISATRSSARWATRRTSSASTPAATSAARSTCSAARSRSRSSPRCTARRSAPIPTHASYGGNPGGFVIAIKNGPTIYHTGDTDLFGDMALIGSHFKIDSCSRASAITSRWAPIARPRPSKLVKAKQVVPMHFGTFPVLTGTPDAFGKALKKTGAPARSWPR